MKKELTIGQNTITIEANAFTPFVYKEGLGRDMIQDYISLEKSGNPDFLIMANLLWAMAKTFDENIEPIKKWIGQFEILDIYAVANDILSLWAANEVQNSKPAKK